MAAFVSRCHQTNCPARGGSEGRPGGFARSVSGGEAFLEQRCTADAARGFVSRCPVAGTDLPSQALEVPPCRRKACPCKTCRPASYRLLLPYPGLTPCATLQPVFQGGRHPRVTSACHSGPAASETLFLHASEQALWKGPAGQAAPQCQPCRGTASLGGTAKPMPALPGVTASLL